MHSVIEGSHRERTDPVVYILAHSLDEVVRNQPQNILTLYESLIVYALDGEKRLS